MTITYYEEGKIYDYTGGLDDLKKGRVRFVGKAEKRMQEDYLRLLRYFRFWAQMGEKRVDPEVIRALPKIVPFLSTLSVDRRRDEMFKIITGPRAKTTLDMMKKLNVLDENLLGLSFSKKQNKVFKERGLEKMLATFEFSEYKQKYENEIYFLKVKKSLIFPCVFARIQGCLSGPVAQLVRAVRS